VNMMRNLVVLALVSCVFVSAVETWRRSGGGFLCETTRSDVACPMTDGHLVQLGDRNEEGTAPSCPVYPVLPIFRDGEFSYVDCSQEAIDCPAETTGSSAAAVLNADKTCGTCPPNLSAPQPVIVTTEPGSNPEVQGVTCVKMPSSVQESCHPNELKTLVELADTQNGIISPQACTAYGFASTSLVSNINRSGKQPSSITTTHDIKCKIVKHTYCASVNTTSFASVPLSPIPSYESTQITRKCATTAHIRFEKIVLVDMDVTHNGKLQKFPKVHIPIMKANQSDCGDGVADITPKSCNSTLFTNPLKDRIEDTLKIQLKKASAPNSTKWGREHLAQLIANAYKTDMWREFVDYDTYYGICARHAQMV